MAAQTRYCGRCGAPVPFGATFCGRCGAPQVTAVAAAAPAYSYPVAPRVPYRTAREWRGSQVAVAGVLLAILAVVAVAITIFAVSHALGGTHPTCTVNCAPKFVTPLPESATFHSSAFGFELDYNSAWTVRSQDSNGISLGTRLGLVTVVGSQGGQPLTQVLQSTVSALPTAQWQDVTQVSDLKGAQIGGQDGIGAVYSANLIGTNSTSAQVRFAVIVAARGGVTVVFFAVDPADPKNSPNGIPEGQSFDYMCAEFRWSGTT
ncbi:MAG TPA: zinc ribbon domain-containing protein [Candidatus Dormibacteraeota bacterium]|nr:zinc ribbon domain-containing protein [Candidatus Dormibacteraeota bacterium]